MPAIRPVVRPGAPVLRRDATHLQIGTAPGVVVPDSPGLLPLLRLLDGVRDVERIRELVRSRVPDLELDVADALRPLIARGAVVDASTLTSSRPDLAVAVHHDRHSEPLVRALRGVLTDAGIRRLDATDPDLLIVLSLGEPHRDAFESALRHSIAHLLVVLDDDRIRVGPFVQPGRTPCLGCLDLHRADWDPVWPALLPQLGRSGPGIVGPALGAPLVHAAAAEIGAEVIAFATGARPRCQASVLALGPAHVDRASRPVTFHHGCGCALLPAA